MSLCQLDYWNKTTERVLIRCEKEIYDVTEYMQSHPGGVKSIIQRAVEDTDCSRDMSFHSPKAIKLWKRMKVGYLVPCSSNYDVNNDDCQCIIS